MTPSLCHHYSPSLAILAYLELLFNRLLDSYSHLPRCQCGKLIYRQPEIILHLTCHSDHCAISFASHLTIAYSCRRSPRYPAFLLTLRPITYLTLLAVSPFVLWLKVLSISRLFRPCQVSHFSYCINLFSVLPGDDWNGNRMKVLHINERYSE